MTIDEMIEVLQAIKAGEKVQAFPIITKGEWFDWLGRSLNFEEYTYRVKPKPMEIYGIICDGSIENTYTNKKIAYESLGMLINPGRVVKFIEVIE